MAGYQNWMGCPLVFAVRFLWKVEENFDLGEHCNLYYHRQTEDLATTPTKPEHWKFSFLTWKIWLLSVINWEDGCSSWPIEVDQFISRLLMIFGLVWNFVCDFYGRWFAILCNMKTALESFNFETSVLTSKYLVVSQYSCWYQKWAHHTKKGKEVSSQT